MILALSVVATHARLPHVFNSMIAVKLFFVISGFYMAMVLGGKYAPTPEGRKRFYFARLLRLVPTYYISILIALGFAVVVGARGGIGFYGDFFARWSVASVGQLVAVGLSQILIFGQDIFLFLGIGHDGTFTFARSYLALPESEQAWKFMLNPPAWSLATELMFYVLAPFLARLNTRWLFALVFLSLAIRMGCAGVVAIREDPWVYRFFPFEIGTFISGMFAYRLYLGWKPDMKFDTVFAKVWPWVALAGIVVLQKAPYAELWLAFLMIPLIPFLFGLSKSNKIDRMIGEYSYPIYILHWPILFGLQGLGVS